MPAYYRLSGGGNDFLALVEPAPPPTGEQVRSWCRRGLSLGADGCFTVKRSGAGSVEMTYYNADGEPAGLCMNAARCAARLAFFLGWAEARVEVRTAVGCLAAEDAGGAAIRLEAPLPSCRPSALRLELGGEVHDGWLLSVGVPHFVLPVPAPLEAVPIATLGPGLRRHPDLGAAGANVDFVRFSPPGRLEIRSFERGVEAETLACGTGVLAAVASGLESGSLRLPVTALTPGGFELRVEGSCQQRRPIAWWLVGDARLVARGEILPEAEAIPPVGSS